MTGSLQVREKLLIAFQQVEGTLYKRYYPDDWRKPRPENFNCSSFAQWIAKEALGWRESEIQGYETLDARRLFGANRFPAQEEKQLLVGDLLLYVDRLWDPTAHHCMISLGGGEAIGACEFDDAVVRRPDEYQRHWRLGRIRRIRVS